MYENEKNLIMDGNETHESSIIITDATEKIDIIDVITIQANEVHIENAEPTQQYLEQNLTECLKAYEDILRFKLHAKNQQEFMKKSLKIFDDVYLNDETRCIDIYPKSELNINGNSKKHKNKSKKFEHNSSITITSDLHIKNEKDLSVIEESERKKSKKRGSHSKKDAKKIKKKVKHSDHIDKTEELIEDIIYSPDSVLCTIDLKDIVNLRTFNNCLTTQEKENLLKYLPHVDKLSKETVHNVFKNNLQFQSSMDLYLEMLESGSFCNGTPLEKKDLLDPYKREHYERFWGEKNQNRIEEEIQEKNYLGIPLDQKDFSFVEYEKEKLNEGVQIENIFPKIEEEQFRIETAKPLTQRRKKLSEVVAEKISAAKTELVKEDKYTEDELDNFNLDEDAPLDESEDSEEYTKTVTIHEHKKKPGRKKQSYDKSYDKSSTFREGAISILRKKGRPLSAVEIVTMGKSAGIFTNLNGKTPQNTIASLLYVDIKKGDASPFVKVGPGLFGLKEF